MKKGWTRSEGYDKMPCRFLEAIDIFESYVDFFEKQKSGK
jgi:hypothetical protein